MRPAPPFSLPDQNAVTRSLADYAGKWLVIYFYPKDNTPGCTKEACNFRDAREAIGEFGKAAIIGVSKDSVASHKLFAELHHLSFPLLSDPNHVMIEAYGSWNEKSFMGKHYKGTSRNTFIISPAGLIAKEYLGVDPNSHAAEIIKDLQALQASPVA
jgi:peroxiredoxin Q/BCP